MSFRYLNMEQSVSFTQPNVLLLIKNSEIQKVVTQLLSNEAFHLFFENSPAKALPAVSAYRPEIVIVDNEFADDISATLFHRIQAFHPAPYVEICNRANNAHKTSTVTNTVPAAKISLLLTAVLKSLLAKYPLPSPEQPIPQRRDIVVGNLRIDRFTKETWLFGKKLELTLEEYDLLMYLVINANSVTKPEELLKRVRSLNGKNTGNSVDLYIARLRKLLSDDSNSPQKIRSVEGGYLLARDAC